MQEKHLAVLDNLDQRAKISRLRMMKHLKANKDLDKFLENIRNNVEKDVTLLFLKKIMELKKLIVLNTKV